MLRGQWKRISMFLPLTIFSHLVMNFGKLVKKDTLASHSILFLSLSFPSWAGGYPSDWENKNSQNQQAGNWWWFLNAHIIRYAVYFMLLQLKFTLIVTDSVLIIMKNAIICMFHRNLWWFSFLCTFSPSQIVYLSFVRLGISTYLSYSLSSLPTFSPHPSLTPTWSASSNSSWSPSTLSFFYLLLSLTSPAPHYSKPGHSV